VPATLFDEDYDQLLQAIYRGAIQQPAWQDALGALRRAFDAHVVSLVLRPPSPGDPGTILNDVRPDAKQAATPNQETDPNAWKLTAYREQFFSLDPFINLPLEQIVSLDDLLSDEELIASDYYRHYLEPVGLFRILGLDTGAEDGLLARLRFSRRRDEPTFSTDDRQRLQRLIPHLRLAIDIHARLNQMTSERDIYAGAVDQLSVATVILNDRGKVLNTNAMATALLEDAGGISLKAGQLHTAGRDTDRQLQAAVDSVVMAQRAGKTSVVRALRVPRQGGRQPLGLVIRPVPTTEWGKGPSGPCAAVFISDPEQRDSASQQTLGKLFDLTPAEANVAILLSRGLSLAEVSEAQNISPHTARAQLKSIFAKTGVSRQAELVRMITRSVAALG
jgi:DNA-binding CsgD family transcriptional regulator